MLKQFSTISPGASCCRATAEMLGGGGPPGRAPGVRRGCDRGRRQGSAAQGRTCVRLSLRTTATPHTIHLFKQTADFPTFADGVIVVCWCYEIINYNAIFCDPIDFGMMGLRVVLARPWPSSQSNHVEVQRRLQEEPKFIAGRRRGTRCCLLTAAVTDSAGRAAAGQGAAASLQQLLPLDDEWLFTFRFWPEHVWEGQGFVASTAKHKDKLGTFHNAFSGWCLNFIVAVPKSIDVQPEGGGSAQIRRCFLF